VPRPRPDLRSSPPRACAPGLRQSLHRGEAASGPGLGRSRRKANTTDSAERSNAGRAQGRARRPDSRVSVGGVMRPELLNPSRCANGLGDHLSGFDRARCLHGHQDHLSALGQAAITDLLTANGPPSLVARSRAGRSPPPAQPEPCSGSRWRRSRLQRCSTMTSSGRSTSPRGADRRHRDDLPLLRRDHCPATHGRMRRTKEYPQVEGLPVVLTRRHANIRRDGHRRRAPRPDPYRAPPMSKPQLILGAHER
jgi:hypothetical protein